MNPPREHRCYKCWKNIPWPDMTHCEQFVYGFVFGINLYKVFCKECTNERRKG